MFYPKYRRIYKRKGEMKVSGKYIADYVGISPAVLSKKMNGKTPWRLEECYLVLDALGIDRSEIYKYFPPEDMEVTENEVLGS